MKYVYTFQGSLTLAPTFIRACWHNFSDVCPYFFLSVPFAEHIVCLYQVNVLVWLSVGLVIFNFQIFQESLWCVSRACPIRNLSSLQYLLSNSLTAHIACTCRLNNNAHWQVNNNSTLCKIGMLYSSIIIIIIIKIKSNYVWKKQFNSVLNFILKQFLTIRIWFSIKGIIFRENVGFQLILCKRNNPVDDLFKV